VFYRFFPLSSLNEVGGDPSRFGTSLSAFHSENAFRQSHWPYSITTTSTHDTKRSEDVRCRIDVLSEIPNKWREALNDWSSINKKHKGLASFLLSVTFPCILPSFSSFHSSYITVFDFLFSLLFLS
jgi:(1->4)-alpha-D-glucan 1-alpha-D-glucosylmutase